MEASAVDIRPLVAEEIELVERHINFDWANSRKHHQRLVKQEEGKGVYLVAWHENLPVGHALVRWDGPTDHPIASKLEGCPDIEDLFAHPDYRSMGVGSQLLQHAETLAAQEGCARIGLGVDVDNPRARTLYERMGFEDTGFGEYKIRWLWTDKDGQTRWAEENCNYLIKKLR